MFVGALEDLVKQPTPEESRKRVKHATTAGFDALNVTTPWAPGQVDPDPGQLLILKNLADAAKAANVRVLVSIFQYRNRDTPITDEEQQQFADYAARLARELPSVRDFIIGNEPNLNGFWFPQFDESGRSAAAPAYTSLLARSYDSLKAVSPEINVIGGSLAPRGADNPNSTRHTQSPTAFIRDMGAAYRASGREQPLMDIFAIHPYLERSAIPPSTEHPIGTSIGIADYDKLVGLLEEAFDGTAQEGGDLPIAYTEFGVQSVIPREQGERVRECHLAARGRRRRRGDAGALLPGSARAGVVPGDRDRRPPLPRLRRARPEPLAVRGLLRGPHAQVEPACGPRGRARRARRQAGMPRRLI